VSSAPIPSSSSTAAAAGAAAAAAATAAAANKRVRKTSLPRTATKVRVAHSFPPLSAFPIPAA
jgi:hypothetical protein